MIMVSTKPVRSRQQSCRRSSNKVVVSINEGQALTGLSNNNHQKNPRPYGNPEMLVLLYYTETEEMLSLPGADMRGF